MGHLAINWNKIEGHNQFMDDFFLSGCTYPSYLIRRPFCMSGRLLRQILDDMEANEPFFQQRRNASLWVSPFTKVTAAV